MADNSMCISLDCVVTTSIVHMPSRTNQYGAVTARWVGGVSPIHANTVHYFAHGMQPFFFFNTDSIWCRNPLGVVGNDNTDTNTCD